MIGYHKRKPQRYPDKQVLGDAKDWIIANDPAQHHDRHNDCDNIDNRLRHSALLLRAAAVLAPMITAPTTSSAMNTSTLRRCWVVARAIWAAGIALSPRRL